MSEDKSVLEQSLRADLARLSEDKSVLEQSLRADLARLSEDKTVLEQSLRGDLQVVYTYLEEEGGEGEGGRGSGVVIAGRLTGCLCLFEFCF